MKFWRSSWFLAVGIPFLFIIVILTADVIESPKTAYVGVLTMVPLFAAIFGTPLQTAFIAVLSLASGWIFGLFAEDGNVPAQTVRLVIIAIMGIIAVLAAALRQRRDRQLVEALREAAKVEEVREQANNDQLTGLLNRRGAVSTLTDPSTDVRALILIDLDRFKEANDRYGHVTGDEFLQTIASRLASNVAGHDVVSRWGGDEFLVGLATDPANALGIAERLMAAVSTQPIKTKAADITVTLSAGVTAYVPGGSLELDAALRRADAALYRAKDAGRNCVRTSWDTQPSPDTASSSAQ